MKVKGKIFYTMDGHHPDIDCVNDWEPEKVYDFEDTYTFLKDVTLEEATAYIKHDLAIVAGGGYNYKHIHNVRYEFEYL